MKPSAESLLATTRRILEIIAADATLVEVLRTLCSAVDDLSPDILSAVMVMDADGRLSPAAAPRLQPAFLQALTALPIDGEPLDIVLGQIALRHGVRTCWSRPIVSREGNLLGSFVMCFAEPRTPTSADLQLIEDAGQIAGIAIEGHESQAALKQAFLEIKNSEHEIRGILDAIPYTVVVLSPDGAALYANQTILDYTGLTQAEVMAPGVRTQIFHPDDLTRMQDERREGMARGAPFETEQRTRRKDGQYRWYLIRYLPLRDEQGRIIR